MNNENLDLQLDDIDINMNWEDVLMDEKLPDDQEISIQDGLIISMNKYAKVDIHYIASLTHKDESEVLATLENVLYKNPSKFNEFDEYEGYETSDEYLSGDIWEKLKEAKIANQRNYGLFTKNIDALRSAMPEDVKVDDIYVTLGTPWLPVDIVEDFILKTFKKRSMNYFDKGFSFDEEETQYLFHDVSTNNWYYRNETQLERLCDSMLVHEAYGVDRQNGLKLVLKMLNQGNIEVTKSIPLGNKKFRTICDEEKTIALNQKADKLRELFDTFISENEEYKKRIKDLYYEKYVCKVPRKYDGSFLILPKSNKDIHLFDYQKNAIARIIQTPNTLLAHNVGAGKTWVLAAAIYELKRMGVSNKNMIVVPNSILDQWRVDYLKLYPSADILLVKPSMFTPEKIQSTLARIRDEDHTCILLPYSCFERIEFSKPAKIKRLSDEINDLQNKEMKSEKPHGWIVSTIKKLKKELGKTLEEDEGTSVYFDQLNINTLVIDEAHNYKNVPFETNLGLINGLNPEGSPKCKDVMDKVRYVQKYNMGRGVIFATGTPITNSISDVWVMQKYLQANALESLGLSTFDAWIGNYAELSNCFEVDVDVSKHRVVRRFTKFHNLPELTTLLSFIADFHESNPENIPSLGAYENEEVNKNDELKQYIEDLSERATKIRKHLVKRVDDNMLKVTTDGRKAALDVRLVEIPLSDFKTTKTYKCAQNVYKLYKDYYDVGGTQLVFCDLSTPKAGFNVYDELKNALISMGIPSEEIAFVHDAEGTRAKEKLFEKVRTSKVRVFIGSTFKLGIGVNVQNHLIALHHLDVPWRPADLLQREGRILRNGNENEKVFIYRYVTEGSFDSYSWQLLETKERFIMAFLQNSLSERSEREISDTILSYAEVKALAEGEPVLKLIFEKKNLLENYVNLQKYNKEKIAKYNVPGLESKLKEVKDDLRYRMFNQTCYGGFYKLLKDEKELISNIFSSIKKNEDYQYECGDFKFCRNLSDKNVTVYYGDIKKIIGFNPLEKDFLRKTYHIFNIKPSFVQKAYASGCRDIFNDYGLKYDNYYGFYDVDEFKQLKLVADVVAFRKYNGITYRGFRIGYDLSNNVITLRRNGETVGTIPFNEIREDIAMNISYIESYWALKNIASKIDAIIDKEYALNDKKNYVNITIKDMISKREEGYIGNFDEFKISLQQVDSWTETEIVVLHKHFGYYKIKYNKDKDDAYSKIEYNVNNFHNHVLSAYESALKDEGRLKSLIAGYKSEIEKMEDYTDQINELKTEIKQMCKSVGVKEDIEF